MKIPRFTSYRLLLAALLPLVLSFGKAAANPNFWVDGTDNDLWDSAANWTTYYEANEVPTSNDIVYINSAEYDNQIFVNGTQDPLDNMIFSGTANGMALELDNNADASLYFDYYAGIFMQANLVGDDEPGDFGGETFQVGIESPGQLFLANFSPANQVTNVAGVNGFDNPLNIEGTVQVDNNNQLNILGSGNVNISGEILGGTHVYQDSSATTTLSGDNNYTGWTIVAGTLVLDNTNDNSDKLSEGILGKDPALVLGENGNGGHLVINGNEAGTAEILQTLVQTGTDSNNNPIYAESAGHLDLRGGTNSVVLNGSTDGGGATTLVMGTLNDGFGTTLDLTANGNAAFYTTSTNNGQYGAQVNILGQSITYDKTYYAQVGNGVAQQGTAGYGANTAETLITPLINDNGDAFNSQWNNYTVDAGGQTINSAFLAATSQQEGADTIRFASAGTLDLGAGTTYTAGSTTTTGNGFLYMVYGGVLVAQGVTGDTAIVNGTLLNGRDLFGLDVLNYSSGTLTIGASLADSVGTYQQGNDRTDTFSFGGGGKIVLSGDNSTIAPGSGIDINSGVIQLANANALGIDNRIAMGDVTSTLDLNGYSARIGYLTSDSNYTPGNQAAAAGLNTKIENTAAGTISRLTIEGYSQPQASNYDGNISSTFIDGDGDYANLGTYVGGLLESSGAIMSLDIEQGPTATGVSQFYLGTSDPFGDATNTNTTDPSGVQGPQIDITGAIIVGQNANLGIVNYGSIHTMGALVLNGGLGAAAQQGQAITTTYLTGTGSVVSGYGYGNLVVNNTGSVTDTFNGHIGTASGGASLGLVVGGTGTLALTNPLYDNLQTEGTSKVILPGVAAGIIAAYDNTSVTLTGTGGTELGTAGNIVLSGTVTVAPTGAGQDVVVSGNASNFNTSNEGALVLDAGANNSLTVDLGNSGGSFYLQNLNGYGALVIGSAQGLSALGTTDRVVALSNGSTPQALYINAPPDGILAPSAYAADYSATGHQSATFLTYSGTGVSTDAGFVGYTFNPSNVNNLANTGGYASINQITSDYTLSANLGYDQIYGLEIDNGATLNVTGGLEIGEDDRGFGSLILNGGHITGNGISISRYIDIYTSLDNGYISSLNEDYGGQEVEKNGEGTLFINSLNGTGTILIDDGVLDTGYSQSEGLVILNGGVFETSDGGIPVTMMLTNSQNGGVVLNDGGFAASGGSPLFLTLVDSTGSKNLVWGQTAYFLGEGSVFVLGSDTDGSSVHFESNINLGVMNAGASGQPRIFEIDNNATLDAGIVDPLNYKDYVVIDGTISSSNPNIEFVKTGAGTLALTGTNTYQGPTVINQGTLAIQTDAGLGTAPSAAYALNTAPGVSGGALTPGAIEINGGASLENALAGTLVLNANRQMLLASGADGSDPAQIYVSTILGTSEIDFGGMIADYVGEVGSLEKNGGGTFNYSGTSLNTGTDSVVQGTLEVSGSGNINSVAGVTIDNTNASSNARFNYASTVGLTQTVSYGSNGGTFSYNSAAAYTGATAMTIGAKQVIGGGGNLGLTNLTIGAGGTILPGNTDAASGLAQVGTLTTGHVALLAGGNYNFLLADMLGAAGTGYSTVNSGPVDLTGLSASNPFNINIETLAGDVPGHPVNLDQLTNYQVIDFVLFDTGTADGVTSLTQNQLDADFAIDTLPNNGATGFDPGPGTWEVTENATDSQLLLEYTAVPEPGTWAMLVGGLGLLFFIRRARRPLAAQV